MRAFCATALCVALWAATAHATCRADGLYVFPTPGAVVPTNVQFVLEGVGSEQVHVSQLNGTTAIALVASGDEPVQVRVERGWVSQMKRVAVRLKPVKALKPNVEYTLALGATFAQVPVLNDALGDNSLRWTTGAGLDRNPPRFRSKPSVAEGFYTNDPKAGLTRQLKLRAVVDEPSAVYLLVTMERVRGGSARQQYPVALDGTELLVGHDGCSGSFGFDDGRTYRLTFDVFDAAGNRSPERPTLDVSAPRPIEP